MLATACGANNEDPQRQPADAGADMIGIANAISIGMAGRSNVVPFISDWEAGYWLDFRPRSGTLSAPFPPDIGAHDFTPVNSPVVDPVGIGGRGGGGFHTGP